MKNWERQEERNRSKKVGREMVSKQPTRPPRSGDCDRSWTSSLRKGGTEVDSQVAAPTESSTPNLHRATIAQQRVRMEGWRQRRLGSNAKPLIERKKKNRLDTHRPSHGRTYLVWVARLFEILPGVPREATAWITSGCAVNQALTGDAQRKAKLGSSHSLNALPAV